VKSLGESILNAYLCIKYLKEGDQVAVTMEDQSTERKCFWG